MLSKIKLSFVIVLVLSLIPSSICQNWADFDTTADLDFDAFEGGQLEHVYSNLIKLEPVAPASQISFAEAFTHTIPTGIFKTTENIYVVVGLFSLEFDDIAAGNHRILWVQKTSVNAAKTELTLTIHNNEKNPIFSNTEYVLLSYSIILIGSDFSGFSETLQSSYIYGKIGEMVNVDPAQTTRVFDFETDDEGSPFDYASDGVLGKGCGMIRRDGNIIIEEDLCQKFFIHAYVVGFQGETITGGDEDEIIIQSQKTSHSFETAAPGISITYNSKNNNDYKINKVQFSFIIIGIRAWSSTEYPVQLTNIDDFTAFAVSALSTGGTKSGILLDLGLSGSPNEQVMNRIPSLSHIFCGLASIVFDDGEDDVVIHIDDVDYDDFFDQGIPGPNQIQFKVNNPVQQSALSCVFLARRQLCSEETTVLQLVPTPDKITFPVNTFQVSPTLNPLVKLPTITPSLKFTFEPSTTADNEVTIVLKYDRSNGDTAFHSNLIFDEELENDNYIKLTVFGHVVFERILGNGVKSLNQDFYSVSNDFSQNLVIIEFRGDAHDSAALPEEISFAIESFENVMDGVTCANQCLEVDDLQAGINFDTPPSCIYCDASLFQDYDHINRTCKCIDRYLDSDLTDDELTCQPCDDSLCASCAPVFNCFVCVAFAQGSPCQCSSKYYEDDGECVPCYYACTTCSSTTDCNDCAINDDTRDSPASACICRQGFYDDGESAICPSCSPECKTCSETATKCTSCDTDEHFQLLGTTCICEDSYYKLQTDTKTTCEKCDETCLTCELSAIKCASCDEENDYRVLSSEDTCECREGYEEIAGECIDTTCQTVTEHCKTCGYDPMTRTTQCLDCINNRILVGVECVCKVGFDEVNNVCKRCPLGCRSCKIAHDTVCTLCALNYESQNADGSCTCPSHTILIEAAGTLFCKDCASKCLTCSGTYDSCDSCKSPFVLDGSECVCPERTFKNQNNQCVPCMAKCDECTSSVDCEDCASGYLWDGSKCDLDCPEGKYKGATECLDCPKGCAVCTSKYHCSSCKTDYNLYAGSCREDCPTGTFSKDQVCYHCVVPCQTCSGSADNCITCVSTKVYFNGQCLDECPDGTFFGDGNCILCSPTCLTCQGASSHCTSCPGDYHLFENSCFEECPGVIIDNKCVAKCPDGKFKDEGTCEACDEKCETCQGSATNCLRCANGYKSHNGECLPECPENYLDKGSYCLPCHSSCLNGCKTTIFFCNQCTPGYVKIGNKCFDSCPQGQYLNYQTSSCEKCNIGCKICTNKYHCTECYDTSLIPYNGICQKSCPPGARLVGDVCVCTFGYFHYNYCVSACPERFYPSDKKCESCQSPCKSCVGSASNCLNCEEGYDFNPQTSKCTPKTNCQYGEYELPNRQCKRRCPYNKFLYSTCCVPFCPSGFQHNNYGGCVEITNPSICQFPQFQQGSSCVSACQVGYYGNIQTRVCEKCSNHCLLCLHAHTCLQCVPGYIPLDGVCVDSLSCSAYQSQYNGICVDGCPIGTCKDGYTCKPVCLEGRYFHDGFCYTDCPTGHHTPEACVQNCNGYDNCL